MWLNVLDHAESITFYASINVVCNITQCNVIVPIKTPIAILCVVVVKALLTSLSVLSCECTEYIHTRASLMPNN